MDGQNKQAVLVIGGGGREHAILWKLRQSKRCGKLYALPGNGGISSIAECVPHIKATDITGILEFLAAHTDIGLVVVAPDDPLALGLVNALQKKGIRAFGPTKEAAVIEGSKIFAKDLMKRYRIPTAQYEVFDRYEAAREYLRDCRLPVVLKADGLALGKGVIICQTRPDALQGLDQLMKDKQFGTAGERIVVEEFLHGFEVSLLAFTDGETVRLAPSCQDYKRASDGDTGPNTGGMGTYSPVPAFTETLQRQAYDQIVLPTVRAMQAEQRVFRGVLYFGLMVTKSGIRVLEYNARFGDPETQVILPRLQSDLLELFEAVIDGTLQDIQPVWDTRPCVCVVAASGGYPGRYETGKAVTIGGKVQTDAEALEGGVYVFHAGTACRGEALVTSGGRVLGVSALAETHAQAREQAYRAIRAIRFDGMYYRTDICQKI